MIYKIAADLVVIVHLLFVAYAVAGGLLVVRRNWTALLHIPAAAWAVLISFYGWTCPLTPLENWLRRQGGGTGYEEGFVEHYLLPLLYPGGMTRGLQTALGLFVLTVNLAAYAWVIRCWCANGNDDSDDANA